jgi:hypothetical protein
MPRCHAFKCCANRSKGLESERPAPKVLAAPSASVAFVRCTALIKWLSIQCRVLAYRAFRMHGSQSGAPRGVPQFEFFRLRANLHRYTRRLFPAKNPKMALHCLPVTGPTASPTNRYVFINYELSFPAAVIATVHMPSSIVLYIAGCKRSSYTNARSIGETTSGQRPDVC